MPLHSCFSLPALDRVSSPGVTTTLALIRLTENDRCNKFCFNLHDKLCQVMNTSEWKKQTSSPLSLLPPIIDMFIDFYSGLISLRWREALFSWMYIYIHLSVDRSKEEEIVCQAILHSHIIEETRTVKKASGTRAGRQLLFRESAAFGEEN